MPTASTDIFRTVPKNDYLSLFHNNQPRYQNVTEFLKFKKEDVSKASSIPLASIRYDDKMPHELQARITEWATLLNHVAEYFQGDESKTALWFTIPNPMLGNITPRDMLRFGRYKKLLNFVMNALSENRR